jgi:hypothetical protein
MTSLSPFLNLAGELRNAIYELVVLNTPLRIFEGHVNLPPLGYVCRQIHEEMTGIFEEHEEDLILDVQNGRLPIKAKIINYDFAALYKWLKRNEGTNDAICKLFGPQVSDQQIRALHIDLIIDVPVIDLTRVEESQLIIQERLARDRKAIDSLNSTWDDAGAHDCPGLNYYSFRGPCVTGRNGTAASSDGYGAKSYGLLTSMGNCYVVTCNVRLNFTPPLKDIPREPFPSGFCHQGDYLDQLFGQTPDGGRPWSPGHQYGSINRIPDWRNLWWNLWSDLSQVSYKPDPTCSFFKVVFGGMCHARATSYWMLWDRKFYARLTCQQRSMVDYYRFLDGGVERRAGILPRRDENDFFEKLDAALKIEDRMDLSE